MAATGTPTTNIGLRRPQGTDPASVDDINYNSELIDTKLGAVGSTSVQEQINTLNSNKANLVQRTIEANATLSLTFSAYATYAIFFCGYVESSRGMLVGTCDTTSILYKTISGAADLNITSSGRTISITNNGQYATQFRMLLFSGTVS